MDLDNRFLVKINAQKNLTTVGRAGASNESVVTHRSAHILELQEWLDGSHTGNCKTFSVSVSG
jgi:hypothetical protein